MLLSEIRSYCAQAGRVSLEQLSDRFDADPEAVRGMMDVLVNKGMVCCLTNPDPTCGKACSGCTMGCASLGLMSDAVYEWVGRRARGGGGTPHGSDGPAPH
ncbi:MAG: hypothetical protein JXJ18_07825 [Rhodobacteraceae bacterium]|nr:hypothetical protein [Paracoccaceae bacterium]